MSQLERQLNLPAVVAISVSTMLGSGLFVLPGLAAIKTGPSIFLAYLFAGLCVLPAALSKAELATAMPTSGGTYVYLERTFGPLVGTISGIGLWLALLLKSAFALVGFSAYLIVLTDVIPAKPAALLMLGLIVVLNMRGVRKVGQVQSVVVAIAIVALVVLFVMGLGQYDPKRLTHLFPYGSWGFIEAAAFVFVSYAGVTKVAAFAEEVKNPKRNLPLGILLSLFIAVVLYGTIALILVAVVPMETLQGDLHPIYTLANSLGGHILGQIAAVIGVATMASMANGGLLAASRFPYAMSRDKLLPAILSKLHKVHLTPVASILVSAAAVFFAIVFFEVDKIAKLASAFMIIIFMWVCATVIVLREVGPKWYRPPYRSPFYPFTQILGILACALLLVVLGAFGLFAAAGIALPGALVYIFYGKARTQNRGVISLRGKRKDLLKSPTKEFAAEGHEILEDARVIVALFGSEPTPELLVEHAAALAEGGAVQVVRLTEVPEQTSLDALMDDDPNIASVQRRTEAVAEAKDFELSFRSIASRDIVKTVYELSNQVHCQWLIMSWSGRSRYSFTFTNPLGWLKSHIACNLAVYRDVGVRYFRKILVYTEPGPHDALIAATADRLATEHGADLTFIRFVADDASDAEVQSEESYLDQMSQLAREPTTTEVLRGPKELKAIATYSAGFDLLVTAEPKASLLGQLLGMDQNDLTDAAACSVMRLQTPRIETHRSVVAAKPADKFVMQDLLETTCIRAQLPKRKKDLLFEEFANTFAKALPELRSQDILSALMERERSQNTAVGHGVALPHATMNSAKRTYLGIFTSAAPIDYEAPDGEGVQVFFVTIGPPSERQTHLHLLAMVSTLALKTDLLSLLIEAKTTEEISQAVKQAQAQLPPKERASSVPPEA